MTVARADRFGIRHSAFGIREADRQPVCDAIVIGGGPAGAAAGWLLASWGYDVALIDRSTGHGDGPRRIAETIPPSARKLLTALGLSEDVDRAAFYPTTGNTSWWGREPKRVERYGGGTWGYQVSRNDFDRLLIGHAARAGVRVESRAVVRRVERTCDGACVEYREAAGGETRRAAARFVLDCSGRAGVVARRGWRVDEPGFATIAVAGAWTRDAGWSACLDDPTHTVVETIDAGWVWSIPTSALRRWFTVMVDRGSVPASGSGDLTAVYRRWLARAPQCARLLGGAALEGKAFACAASLYSARTYADGPFLLVGDAGSFIDPLSSFGVKKALASAWRAAVVVNTALARPERAADAFEFFSSRERSVYESYLRQAARYFHAGAEAHSHRFWRNRAHAASAAGEPIVESGEHDLAGDDDVRRAFERLKASDRVALRRAADVSVTRRPEIVGREVALVDWLVSRRVPGGIRYAGGVELPSLLAMAADHDQVADLFEAYRRRQPRVGLPEFLGALALLVGKGLLVAALVLVSVRAWAAPAGRGQAPREPAKAQEAKVDEQGLPVRSALVRDKCAACHKVDEQGRMTRISYRRATPEGWQATMRRMVALNNLVISPEDARAVVRYLATYHGLAPEESRPAAFEVERRIIDYKYADRDTERTCSACHSMGRVIAERRTKEDWGLLVAMHRGFYPLADFQSFRRTGPPQREPGPDGRPPDNRHPMDKAIEHLSGAFPLQTPEWSAWSATMRAPQLEGRWALAGYQPGKGTIFGDVTITRAGDADFTTEIRFVVARTGETVSRQGKAIVYTGYQWRGRSTPAVRLKPDTTNKDTDVESGFSGTDLGFSRTDLREVMFVERDWRRMSGRWFTGGYDELGLDVTLRRIGRDAMLLGTDRQMLTRGGTNQEVRLFGVNLPAAPSPADFDFGPGIRVSRIVSATPQLVVLAVDVAADAVIGARDVFLGDSAAEAAVVVFERIDAIKIAPQAGLARVGGVTFPKQYQQFEAIAYSYGPDGKPDTKDDVRLGLVEAAWTIEEFTATFADDDRQFVGTIDRSGLFTPNVEGPNPKRANNANNYGDVWVVATYTPADAGPAAAAGAALARPLRGRAHLLVTVPLYMRWETTEGSR